jgi:hypothetical protein
MLLIKLLLFCEQAKDRTQISFRTKNFQGDLTVDEGNVTQVSGLEPDKLRQALFEEALEVYLKKTSAQASASTKLPISTLTVETAAFLHQNLENKTSFSSLTPSAESLFSKTAPVIKRDILMPTSALDTAELKNSNSFALRKTINVDLKALSSSAPAGAEDSPAGRSLEPIELHFTRGVPENKTMGRSPECEIVVDAADASRKHCRLTFNGTNLIVKDLGSSNGTFINNRVVIESNASSNDILQLGATPYLICIN